EFVEAADLAVRRLVLMQEGKLVVVENLEELVPADLFEAFLGLLEIDTQNAACAAGRTDLCGPAFTPLDPFADFVVIGGGTGFGHECLHRIRNPSGAEQ